MRRFTVAALLMAPMLAAGPAWAEYPGGRVKIGVLTDLSGVYSDIAGKGSVIATRMAIDDCMRAECAGMLIEAVVADHQNKADVALAAIRSWIDRDEVDAVTDMGNASIQLAAPSLLREKNRVGIFAGGTARLTGDACEPGNVVQWLWDTYVQVSGVTRQLTRPGTKWELVTADYALGHQFEADAKTLVAAAGGTVVGSVRYAFPGTDFSSPLLTAQGSGADVVALANAGRDTVNAIKTAHEFGMPTAKQALTAYFATVMDVHGVGLEVAQGLVLSEAFYWDVDDRTRAFSERFRALNGTMPSTNHAGIYSGVRHYLKAVAATRSTVPAVVIPAMRAIPIEDEVVRNASLRVDGRMVHDVYVFRVKKPAESRGEWDLYEPLATIPGEQAFRPLAAGGCRAVSN